ncbi:hypothetical protein QYF61_015394 [Mycteria americana]|uniref:Uncharacterized protein n=1 Tax=Mycteria americana TaxID=33587 RepID=A0AAN7RZZ8_MYCAM|nr:hypothetical protein QYF61_015394 [Mycteria americana]
MQDSKGTDCLRSSSVKKDQGVLVDFRLSMNPQCTLAARKANNIPGCANRSIVGVSVEMITPLYLVLIRPQLKYCAQFWPPSTRRMVNWSERSPHQRVSYGAEQLPRCDLLRISPRHKLLFDRTRGNGLKLHQGRFRLDIGKFYFTERVVKHWNRLPREVVESPSLEYLKDVWMRCSGT